MSTPVITLTSPSKTGIISHPPADKTTSFSCLDGAHEETFVLKLGISTQHHHHHVFLGKSTTDDREIDVFDAQRYFNEGLNRSPKIDPKKLPSNYHQQKKDDQPVEPMPAPKMSALRSTRSESSTNSQSALLPHNPRNLQQPKKSFRKGFLASIACNCSCADKNSVDIDDYSDIDLVYSKSQQGDKTRDRNQAAKMDTQEEEDQAKRKAIEAIRISPILENRKNGPSLEKKLNMMPWAAITPGAAEEMKIPSIEMKEGDDDSDGSSDLFEIESLSKGKPFLSRQASDGLSGCMTPRTCYPPSEASIEWSIVTASAADFSVDSEELGLDKNPQKGGQNSRISSFKEIPKLRPGILSGCKSVKAVSVAGDAHKINEPGIPNGRKHLRADSLAPMTRFCDENKLGGFGAKIRPQSFDNTARVLPQSRSANPVRLLYT